MPAPFCSETAKIREMPHVMRHITGKILDYGCGGDKITPEAVGMDGRSFENVDGIVPDLENLPQEVASMLVESFDTVYSSHFLEHCVRPLDMVHMWYQFLKPGGKLVLYLPDGRHYNHHNNFEHMWDINYDNFLFWFKRLFCGEGRDFRGNNRERFFELLDHGMDVGDDRYSFYIVARAL
jgi:SAM-dependent methyltransferase